MKQNTHWSDESNQHALASARLPSLPLDTVEATYGDLYGLTSMTNRWLALPTRSVEVERTFSLPQPSTPSSSFRTCRSMVAVTSTSNFPAASGVPESAARVRVQLEPTRPLQGIPSVFDVPKVGDLRLPFRKIAQGAIGGTWPRYSALTLACNARLAVDHRTGQVTAERDGPLRLPSASIATTR